MQWLGAALGGGLLGGMLGGGPGQGYRDAQGELMRYYGNAQGRYGDMMNALSPFRQYGLDAYKDLRGGIGNLLNPQELMKKWTEGYTESPEAIQAEGLATTRGLDAAGAMGLGGSSAAQRALQQGTSNIVMQDRNRYLDNLMNKYTTGLGMLQNIYGTGYNAASNIGSNAMAMAGLDMRMGENMGDAAARAGMAPWQFFSGAAGAALPWLL